MTTPLDFVHAWHPGGAPDAPVVLALHGTGGNEHDLVPLAREVAPGAAILSPRGKVLEQGMPRFFRRLAEGVFDLEDLRRRTVELGAFVQAAAAHYGFDESRVTAMGFSNGANIAASLMLRAPGRLRSGILFRAMVPFEPDTPPPLDGTRVLLSEGGADPLVSRETAERLASILRAGGAEVTLEWQEAGHQLTQRDVDVAKAWFAVR